MAERRRSPAARRRTPTRAQQPARGKRQAAARARHPASRTPVRRRPASPRVRRRRAVLSTILLGLAIVTFLFAFVYPTSTFLRQRSEVDAAQRRLERLETETARLWDETEMLLTDEEVERLAREQYGLVRPGETPYVLVPAAPDPATTPAG